MSYARTTLARMMPWAVATVVIAAVALLATASSATARAPRALPAGSGAWRERAEILRLEDRREPVHRLAPYLEASAAELRARAALAVGRIAGPGLHADDREAAVARALLAERLRADSDPQVRCASAFALGLLQTDAAGATVAAWLARGAEPDAAVRAAAVEALGRCGPDPHPAAMRAALADADPHVVHAALLAVWKGSGTAHLERVIELSHVADAQMRWRAAYALMRSLGAGAAGRTPIPGGAALDAPQRLRLTERLLELATDPDVRVRLQALRGLRSVDGSAELRARIGDVLHGALGDADPRVRVEALRSLGAVFERAGGQAPEALAFCDPHPHVQVEVYRALAHIQEPPALMDLLAGGMTAAAEWEREVALEVAISACRRAGLVQQALHLAQRALNDPSWRVRSAAASELAAVWEHLHAGEAGPAGAGESGSASPGVLRDLAARYLLDEPRVAKAVVGTWMSMRTAEGAQVGDLLGEMEAHLAGDDEVLRLLVVGGLRAHVTGREPSSLQAGELALLAERIGALAGDPAADVRAGAVGLAGALLATEARAWSAEWLLRTARSDADRLVRLAAIKTLREAATEVDAWRDAAETLAPGPQETGLRLADYEHALREVRACTEAVVQTHAGELRFTLLGDDAPLTVYNFVRLADSGYFDGSAWHRVVPDFVVQDGCPRGDGWGGPSHSIRCEYNPLHYEPGMVGMALSGADTGGSQFFIALSDQPHLDGRYTIFGRLSAGWEVLAQISQGDPIERVLITRAPGGR